MTQDSDSSEGFSLDDLYTDAMLAGQRTRKPAKIADAGEKHSLDAEAKRMKELYNLPENWERTRGVSLIDKASKTLIGNYSEYVHRIIPHTRKLCREHLPISIDAVEEMEGYMGTQLEQRLRGNTWEAEHFAEIHLLLDGLMVEAPLVKVRVKTRLGVIVRCEVEEETQFANGSGSLLLRLPAGTDIWQAMGADSKRAARKAVGL